MKHTVTLIPGDGTGPELAQALETVIAATGVSIEWDRQDAGFDVMAHYGTPLPEHVLASVRRNRVAIKGPITTPVGTGFRSVNVALRKELDLYACLRPAKSLVGVKSRFTDIDLVIVRENTEDLYAGIEHMVGEDAAESIKIITRKGSERIARFAFEYARTHGRRKVTAVHKANIMKCTDGLFLRVAGEVAEGYPDIEFEDRIVDNMCMQLVQKPELYDVLVLPNLYGDIVSDLCAGLVGGLGVAPGANIGAEAAVFEPVHGSAPKYAGQDKVDPTAILRSGVLMLDHLGEDAAARRMEAAIAAVIAEGREVTYDLGGLAGTQAMAAAIAAHIASRRGTRSRPGARRKHGRAREAHQPARHTRADGGGLRQLRQREPLGLRVLDHLRASRPRRRRGRAVAGRGRLARQHVGAVHERAHGRHAGQLQQVAGGREHQEPSGGAWPRLSARAAVACGARPLEERPSSALLPRGRPMLRYPRGWSAPPSRGTLPLP
jgi:isocitrate dehydrogenase (NAD+)